MYINFWYPIVRSEDLGYDQPEKVRALGIDLVAFRDQNGDAHVLSDTCTHRGASLGGAWSQGNRPRVIDGCIVCPYHGWEFNGDGECVNIPSIGYGTKTPARAKVDSYPVEEKYGIVFAFLGDEPEESRIPLLDVEEYGQEGWVANEVLVLEVPYYYERSIENGIDPAHNEFVHPTHGHSSIDRETYRVREYEAEDHRQGWGFWFWHLFDTPPLPQKDDATAGGQETPWGDTRTEDHVQMKVGGGTYGPNSMPTYINITDDKMFRQYFFELPVDEYNTKIFFLNMRNFLLETKHNGPIHARNKVIAQQDIQILDTMCPGRTPLSPTKEVLTPSDNGVAAYRKWLEKFDDMGWRIDIDKFNDRHGKTKAYAIPGPSRRTSGNWVLDAIPLIKDRAERKKLEEAE
ncbi:MAG: aromatic ring-hydroxylating dioxygenase subunit alpha [Gammaproteobacteria bacterium]|jgi:phenylpropionate dioxygenase-like ring-hydroxylating dioxygenase large terminal subunit|nr:aromatic ring-hydroxylating dioxygenase subunit alpha [Gammaproteobacteria bacterium]MDP6694383.1 aromatic ring-hydroxylating dioxygenase subunit alpha [Gammaproteobacteria bacterium]